MARFLGIFPDEPDEIDVIVAETRREAVMMGYISAKPEKPKPKHFPSPMDAVQWRWQTPTRL